MPVVEDKEFGTITIRRSGASNGLRARVAPNGTLSISVSSLTPMFVVKRMIGASRAELRKLLATRPSIIIRDGEQIGKSHSMIVRTGPSRSVSRKGLRLIVTVVNDDDASDPILQEDVRAGILAILRKEAKAHLPRRIAYLAETHGFTFSSLRFTHASTRWGSCNSHKAISLNIALMNLPFDLIDYVLVHELAHTRELNHSAAFWNHVAAVYPNYKALRNTLKAHSPNI